MEPRCSAASHAAALPPRAAAPRHPRRAVVRLSRSDLMAPPGAPTRLRLAVIQSTEDAMSAWGRPSRREAVHAGRWRPACTMCGTKDDETKTTRSTTARGHTRTTVLSREVRRRMMLLPWPHDLGTGESIFVFTRTVPPPRATRCCLPPCIHTDTTHPPLRRCYIQTSVLLLAQDPAVFVYPPHAAAHPLFSM